MHLIEIQTMMTTTTNRKAAQTTMMTRSSVLRVDDVVDTMASRVSTVIVVLTVKLSLPFLYCTSRNSENNIVIILFIFLLGLVRYVRVLAISNSSVCLQFVHPTQPVDIFDFRQCFYAIL